MLPVKRFLGKNNLPAARAANRGAVPLVGTDIDSDQSA